MQPLDYEPPSTHRTATWLVVLWAVPILAFYVGMLTGMLGVAEPFFVLKATDAAVFFGAPVTIIALAILWYRVALVHRVHRVVIVLVLVWFVLIAAATLEETLSYLREPWNV